jgi:hypothetical protein
MGSVVVYRRVVSWAVPDELGLETTTLLAQGFSCPLYSAAAIGTIAVVRQARSAFYGPQRHGDRAGGFVGRQSLAVETVVVM